MKHNRKPFGQHLISNMSRGLQELKAAALFPMTSIGFKDWLQESVLPSVQRAMDMMGGREDRKRLIKRIIEADPYDDKRFVPIITGWIIRHGITPEEHADDIARFKELRRKIKGMKIPAKNVERSSAVKELLSKKPEDFSRHYADLQEWNKKASDILDPEKDLDDKGLPVVMRYGGFTMYRIDRKEQCNIPLIKNSMSWCVVTREYYGLYGKPPYYPIIRDIDREPFAIVIPSYFEKDPEQAVRNASNTGKISPSDLEQIRPLLQHVLPMKKYKHPYIKAIHGIKPNLPEEPTAKEAFDIINEYGIKLGEWPEGEAAIAKSSVWAYFYAKDFIKGRFVQAENIISETPGIAYKYAVDVIRGPWPKGEKVISESADDAYRYAADVIKGPWPKGEEAISKSAEYSYKYAFHVIKGPWPQGEKAISESAAYSYGYAENVIKGRFPLGEPEINKNKGWKEDYERMIKRIEESKKPLVRRAWTGEFVS